MAKSSIAVSVFENIVKSASDDRLYRGIKLENGMKILLISDSKTDKSAASVNVNAGSLMESIPGLAHFCEHMLFLGSKKYPSENTYSKFIQDHSGRMNAYTFEEKTVYFFEIANDNLKEALDIFAQLFISPLFDPDSTDREINAVNSENNKNLKSDYWRLRQFIRSLCLENHPYSGFGTGSTTTLKTEPEEKGMNVRDELLKFHTKYYSANLMTGCILGAESLDRLQEYAVEMFSAIPNKNLSITKFDANVFKENASKCIHYVLPVEDLQELNLLFQIPDLRDHYESNPVHYVTYLVENKGPGSLLSYLKEKSWCNSLYVYVPCKDEVNGINSFVVTFELTDEGTGHLTEIIELFFQYINLLRKTGVEKWKHDEIVDLGKVKFNFQDKVYPMESVLNLSFNVHKYKFDDVLYANEYETKYEPHLVEQVIKQLNPELMVAIAMSKKYEGTTNKAEKWYGTQYRSDQISIDQLKKWQNCGLNDAFKLPEPNKFIPNDFTLIKDDISKFPEVLKETALMRIWYKGDDKFLLPKAHFNIALRNPLFRISAKNVNMTELFIRLVNDSLAEFTYAIEMAGLYYDSIRTNYGIKIIFNGFNNKLDDLFELVIKRFITFKIDENRFKVILEGFKKHLENYQADQPCDQASELMELLLIENSWSNEELVEAIDSITANDLQNFISSLLTDGIFIEALVYGNISKENTIKTFEKFQTILQSSTTTSLTPSHKSKQYNSRYVKLPNLCDMVYLYNNKIHETIAIEAIYQCEKNDIRNNVLLDLYCQIVSESAFDTLRTREQLGYIVSCDVSRFMVCPSIRFIIQSDKNPIYLDERIENFIVESGETLKNMTDEQFRMHVEAVKINKLEEPKAMWHQRDKYWFEIIEHKIMFDRANIEVAYLNTVTKSDVIDFYMKVLCASSQTRKKLAVYVTPVSMNREVEEKIKNKKINDITVFKATMELCPQPLYCTQV